MSASDAYLAGFFDGEGCIAMRANNRCQTYRMTVDITSSCRAVLEQFQIRFGGSVHPVRRFVNKPLFQWQLNGRAAILVFLRAIRPFAIEKLPQVEAALQWQESQPLLQQTGPRNRPTPEYDRAAAEQCCARLRELKRAIS